MLREASIIYQGKDFLALDKPAGIAVHGGPAVRGATIADWLIRKYPELKGVGDDPKMRPGIVHRLDRDTSGVMIVARTPQAFEDLKRRFQERSVEKTYLALVVGAPKERRGTIETPIGRSIRDPRRRKAGEHARSSRSAVTHYRILERFGMAHHRRLGGYSLLEVKPKTGRMHQIRVHLTSLGCPVAGDTTYGGERAAVPGLGRQFLHAFRLEFSYPVGKRWRFEAPLPDDLNAVLRQLRRIRKYARRRG